MSFQLKITTFRGRNKIFLKNKYQQLKSRLLFEGKMGRIEREIGQFGFFNQGHQKFTNSLAVFFRADKMK